MILSDDISLLLPVFNSPSLHDISIDPDPNYFYDLKLHFRQKADHWKNVKQYRKNHSENRDNRYRMDGEINYIKDEIKTLHQDIEYFMRANPSMNAREGAQVFCKKWRGYLLVYGEEIVRRAFLRCEYYKK